MRWQTANNLFYCQLTVTINIAVNIAFENKLYELFIQ